jgi:ankyrin repeat protein
MYSVVALATFLVGAGIYFVSHRNHQDKVGLVHQPPVAFTPNIENKGEPCLANTLYLWNKVDDIEAGVINPYCADLQSDLLNAAINNDVAAARLALAQGASPNSPGYKTRRDYYETERPLVSAAWEGSTEVAALMLDNSADMEQEYCCCMSCRTALDMAVEAKHIEMVRLLLARGANANHTDSADPTWTTLRRAEEGGDKEIISLLRQSSR